MDTNFDFTTVGIDNNATHTISSIFVDRFTMMLTIVYCNHIEHTENTYYMDCCTAKNLGLINFEALNKIIP